MTCSYPDLNKLVSKAFSLYKTRALNPMDITEWDFLNDCETVAFDQTWGSTALGFYGYYGGWAVTKALTTIITYDNYFFVFFSDDWAYVVYKPNEQFTNDMKQKDMVCVMDAYKYADNRSAVEIHLPRDDD